MVPSLISTGNILLSVPNENAILVFSFIGYNPQKITVGGQTNNKYCLSSISNCHAGGCSSGIWYCKKSDLTGSITAVKQDDYINQPVNRVDQILQGRTAGVNVMNASGAPGGASVIRIRGSNSITGNNDPLYVIDGFVGAGISGC